MKNNNNSYNNRGTQKNKKANDDWPEMDDSKPISFLADLAMAFGAMTDVGKDLWMMVKNITIIIILLLSQLMSKSLMLTLR